MKRLILIILLIPSLLYGLERGSFHADMKLDPVMQYNYVEMMDNETVAIFNWYAANYYYNPTAEANFQDYISIAKEKGIKVIIGLDSYLILNWEIEWSHLLSVIDDLDIYGFYIDEPIHNNIPQSTFKGLTKRIRSDLKDIVVLTSITSITLWYSPIDELRDYLEHVTDIAYVHYSLADWYNTSHAQFQTKLESIGKDCWGIAATWNYPASAVQGYQDFVNWYKYATEKRYKGILCFSFASSVWEGLNTILLSQDEEDKALSAVYKGDLILSEQDFSSIQGFRGWTYDGMVWANKWVNPDDGWCYVDKYEVHAGLNIDNVRIWTAYQTGNIRILSDDNVRKLATCGDGVLIEIKHNNLVVFNKILIYDDTVGFGINLTLNVTENDNISFIVNSINDNYCDKVRFNLIITYE